MHKCNFHTHKCDFDTYECYYDTHNCGLDTHEYLFNTLGVTLKLTNYNKRKITKKIRI
jgi:hypothetical protein